MLIRVLEKKKMSYEFLPIKKLKNRQITLDSRIPASGDCKFMRHALICAGLKPEKDLSYPECLIPFLGRTIKKTVLKNALKQSKPIFIKPSEKTKRFTGFVCTSPTPFETLGVNASEPVYVSPVIPIISEFRTYVVNGEPQHTAYAAGNRHAKPDQNTIEKMCDTIPDVPWKSGFALDTAVLSTGETVLLEVNDGFAVGAYGSLPDEIYFNMISARWHAQQKQTIL